MGANFSDKRSKKYESIFQQRVSLFWWCFWGEQKMSKKDILIKRSLIRSIFTIKRTRDWIEPIKILSVRKDSIGRVVPWNTFVLKLIFENLRVSVKNKNIFQFSQPIRLLLAYTETEHEEKFYKLGPAPEFDKSDFQNVKDSLGLDFPNLPYYIDGNFICYCVSHWVTCSICKNTL